MIRKSPFTGGAEARAGTDGTTERGASKGQTDKFEVEVCGMRQASLASLVGFCLALFDIDISEEICGRFGFVGREFDGSDVCISRY